MTKQELLNDKTEKVSMQYIAGFPCSLINYIIYTCNVCFRFIKEQWEMWKN